jgi:hypothetical protein
MTHPAAASPSTTAVRALRVPVAPHWIEFDELEADDADERDLVRLIEAQGGIPAGAWEFDVN